ncbi:hypothetical protein [Methanoculleus chikugoensis]|nr:hypothetical protein [Methanoculleus chikugoensis]
MRIIRAALLLWEGLSIDRATGTCLSSTPASRGGRSFFSRHFGRRI